MKCCRGSIEIDDAIKPDAPILHEFLKFEGKAFEHRRQARSEERRRR